MDSSEVVASAIAAPPDARQRNLGHDAVTVGRLHKPLGAYRVVSQDGCLVRAGAEPTSEALHTLPYGSVVQVYDMVGAPPGAHRVRFSRPDVEGRRWNGWSVVLVGWVSAHSQDGQVLLELTDQSDTESEQPLIAAESAEHQRKLESTHTLIQKLKIQNRRLHLGRLTFAPAHDTKQTELEEELAELEEALEMMLPTSPGTPVASYRVISPDGCLVREGAELTTAPLHTLQCGEIFEAYDMLRLPSGVQRLFLSRLDSKARKWKGYTVLLQGWVSAGTRDGTPLVEMTGNAVTERSGWRGISSRSCEGLRGLPDLPAAEEMVKHLQHENERLRIELLALMSEPRAPVDDSEQDKQSETELLKHTETQIQQAALREKARGMVPMQSESEEDAPAGRVAEQGPPLQPSGPTLVRKDTPATNALMTVGQSKSQGSSTDTSVAEEEAVGTASAAREVPALAGEYDLRLQLGSSTVESFPSSPQSSPARLQLPGRLQEVSASVLAKGVPELQLMHEDGNEHDKQSETELLKHTETQIQQAALREKARGMVPMQSESEEDAPAGRVAEQGPPLQPSGPTLVRKDTPATNALMTVGQSKSQGSSTDTSVAEEEAVGTASAAREVPALAGEHDLRLQLGSRCGAEGIASSSHEAASSPGTSPGPPQLLERAH